VQSEHAAEGLSFLNNIVRHDLRNDLQVIDANAELIVTSGDATEAVTDRAASIHRST
jgi:hypothetical protein